MNTRQNSMKMLKLPHTLVQTSLGAVADRNLTKS